MKFQIINRFSGHVQYECELRAGVAGSDYGFKLGVAIQMGVSSGADLSGADLSGAVLSGAVLRGAVLRGADLRDADLRDAFLNSADFSGADLRDADLFDDDRVPKIQNIHSVVYDAASKPHALDMTTWHCGTTHCRAGWVVTLAGDGGKALEQLYGPGLAAALIYQASDPKLNKIPNFYTSNEAALADMKKMAEEEMARGAV